MKTKNKNPDEISVIKIESDPLTSLETGSEKHKQEGQREIDTEKERDRSEKQEEQRERIKENDGLGLVWFVMRIIFLLI